MVKVGYHLIFKSVLPLLPKVWLSRRFKVERVQYCFRTFYSVSFVKGGGRRTSNFLLCEIRGLESFVTEGNEKVVCLQQEIIKSSVPDPTGSVNI
jgi:hypothetical protein